MEDNIVHRFSKESDAGSSNNINRDIYSQNHVRTVPEIIMAEKGPKATKLMSNLTNVIEVKKRHFEEMERKYMETKNTISKLIAENDNLQQSFYEEAKEIQFNIREHFQWICSDHEIVNLKLQRQEKELELRSAELHKREVVNQKNRKRLAKEIEQERMIVYRKRKDVAMDIQKGKKTKRLACCVELMEDNIVQSFGEKSDAGSSNNINREIYSQNDVRTISEIIMAEKGPKATKLMSNLTNVIEVKKRRFEEMQRKYMETKNIISKLIAENDNLQQSFYEEGKEMQFNIREHFQWICNDHEIVNLKLQRQEKELELRSAELHKCEVVNQKKRKRLAKEIEQNAAKNSLLQEQRKANESMMKRANDHMNEKEKLLEKIIFLKKQLDGKQVTELQKEKERLKGQINAMKYRRDHHHFENQKKVEDIRMNLHDKDEELEDLKCFGEALFVKQRINNIMLKETREELIEGLKELKSGNIGVKMVVEYEFKPFYDALIRRDYYNETEAKDDALKLCLKWQELLQDPKWPPYKVIYGDGIPQGVIEWYYENKLRILKRHFSDEMYEGMMTTWRKNNDYNYGGRFVRRELWNFTESRKATPKEGVSSLLKLWDAQKRMKRT